MLDQKTKPYKELALRLDELPNGFPATKSGAELLLLEKLFTPEEATIAANLNCSLETPKQIAERIRTEDENIVDDSKLRTHGETISNYFYKMKKSSLK